jgi:hypothetical protein
MIKYKSTIKYLQPFITKLLKHLISLYTNYVSIELLSVVYDTYHRFIIRVQ